MPSTVQPIIVTPDLERLRGFYTGVLGANEFLRFPEEGPAFYVGLSLGDSELGLSQDEGVAIGEPTRILLSIDVPDVDDLLDRVRDAGGTVQAPPNDMDWGQRVAHVRDPDGNALNLTQDL